MTGHKPSEIENSKLMEIVSGKNLHLFVGDSYFYRFMKIVISITTLTFKESGKFEVYFHNYYGVYIFCSYFL